MDLTQERLWAYATAALNSWCSNRKIVERVQASAPVHAEFNIAARHGDVLRTDPQERIDLVLTVVSGAWPAFVKHALQEGGWNPPRAGAPRRPARAPTSPAGSCNPSPRHYRRWCLQRDRRLAELA
jgi:hypothetical protein